MYLARYPRRRLDLVPQKPQGQCPGKRSLLMAPGFPFSYFHSVSTNTFLKLPMPGVLKSLIAAITRLLIKRGHN